jgi:hypothetical protein
MSLALPSIAIELAVLAVLEGELPGVFRKRFFAEPDLGTPRALRPPQKVLPIGRTES